ncbi:hypothetical protein EYW49_00860 [Siculibacillus lacustris]|uniref:Uncharacterized protein n=1 Tax=Siculibacillus lacustris TaxID=1549641 RepID=A0A4Q9VXT5_9HYPH|nr:hypothetical protein [Siculibacillus lacustris]TBW41307.1 hypothetical protein EYW49_00860 [Siculibacillus lacustris]
MGATDGRRESEAGDRTGEGARGGRSAHAALVDLFSALILLLLLAPFAVVRGVRVAAARWPARKPRLARAGLRGSDTGS